MPRILRILNRLAVGGPLLNASYLTKYMAPEFETLLVVGEREGHEKDASFVTEALGIQPVYISEMGRSVDPRKDYKAYQRMKQLIADFKPDIIHSHAAKPGAIGRLAARAMKVPVVVHTFHGHVFHSYFNPVKTKLFINIERRLGKNTDAIIAISEQQRKELVEDFRIAKGDKFRVIPLGLDLDKFQLQREEKRKRFRQEFGIGEEEIVVTIIGRVVPVKNHALFIEAVHHVLQHSNKKIRAVIVGDGESRPSLEAKAKALGIGFSTEKETIHTQPLLFTSWRSDIDAINAGSDIITLTSFNEGTPVSLIEALAAAKPIVSTKVGGVEDVVTHGETGLLSAIDDVSGFCKNLLRMVEDDELRHQMGNTGESHVLKKYSYRRLVEDMTALYNELLSKKKHV